LSSVTFGGNGSGIGFLGGGCLIHWSIIRAMSFLSASIMLILISNLFFSDMAGLKPLNRKPDNIVRITYIFFGLSNDYSIADKRWSSLHTKQELLDQND
jgi:hypothetical protein